MSICEKKSASDSGGIRSGRGGSRDGEDVVKLMVAVIGKPSRGGRYQGSRLGGKMLKEGSGTSKNSDARAQGGKKSEVDNKKDS